MWQAIVFGFLGGVMGANGYPHFTRGITKRRYPCGLGNGPVPNFVAGWAAFAIGGAVLLRPRRPASRMVSRRGCGRGPADGALPRRSRGIRQARATGRAVTRGVPARDGSHLCERAGRLIRIPGRQLRDRRPNGPDEFL